jgi:hypothetical protein
MRRALWVRRFLFSRVCILCFLMPELSKVESSFGSFVQTSVKVLHAA